VAQAIEKEPLTFTDILRARFQVVVNPAASFLNRLGLTPNMVTVIGLLGNILGAAILATGQISLGGFVILLMAPLDAVDGSMARLSGLKSDFGAFLDSVTDRYSELAIFGGLLVYFMQQQDTLSTVVVYLAAIGSLMVSYTRARAQSVGLEAKVGLLSRVERFLILVPCLLINQPLWALWLIAILSNITAIQRVWYVRKAAFQNAKSD
jgi:CDP-diacylglycerol---glycerol-3-phosphate 3-phosphatidyltransferase